MIYSILRSSMLTRTPLISILNNVPNIASVRFLSLSKTDEAKRRPNFEGPKKWPLYNDIVFPPQDFEEKKRPAYICHMKANAKYSPWKLWYLATLVRGMSVDEALRQLEYVKKKGAGIVKQTLLEAQDLAVKNHHVEFRSNLWIAESFVGKGFVAKGMRRHARGKMGMVEYFHCHYLVRLEEGSPPKNFHVKTLDGPTLLQKWLEERREERISFSM